MKIESLRIWVLLPVLITSINQASEAVKYEANSFIVSNESKDKIEVRSLIRQVLNWSESGKSIALLPLLEDKRKRFYTGVDFATHKQNLQKLQATNYFAAEFIANYNQIVVTLDKGIKNGRYGKLQVAELPTFNFASNVNPWSLSQDVPYDKPNPWNLVEIETLKLTGDKGEFNWKWGRPDINPGLGWKEFRYRFRVVKENNKWKIAYLEGFDLKKSTATN